MFTANMKALRNFLAIVRRKLDRKIIRNEIKCLQLNFIFRLSSFNCKIEDNIFASKEIAKRRNK